MQIIDYRENLSTNTNFANQALLKETVKHQQFVWQFRDVSTSLADLEQILRQLDGNLQIDGQQITVVLSGAAGRYLSAHWLDYFPTENAVNQALLQLVTKANVYWQAGRFRFNTSVKPIIYGILNLTPDSFYDGGRYQTDAAMLEHVQQMIAAGVDVIEVNGQTTRPGFKPVTPEVELERILPAIKTIRKQFPTVALAVDTYKAPVMQAVIQAGVDIVNDVNAFTDDPQKLALFKDNQVGLLTMHSSRQTEYPDLTTAMHQFFEQNIQTITDAGVQMDRIALDQGIGYSKVPHGEQDYVMMHNLAEFNDLKRPMMVAISRKGYLGLLLGLAKEDRLPMTLVTETLMYLQGGRILRVHDVTETAQLVKLLTKIENSFWIGRVVS